MGTYDDVMAAFGEHEPVTVELDWPAEVVVHPSTLNDYIAELNEYQDERDMCIQLAISVTVGGEKWSPAQWGGLPSAVRADVLKVYGVVKQVNGRAESAGES